MSRVKMSVAVVAFVVIVVGAVALTSPVEAGPVFPFPISCANVLCLPCPPGSVPAPTPTNPKNLADLHRF